MNNSLIVNFWGGPCSGKSTMMANCFAELKWKGYDCEIVTEYAKSKIWEGSLNILKNQFYISANQYRMIYDLNGKVEVILTDSPLLLGLIYGKNEPIDFKNALINYFNSFLNLNIFLERNDNYNPNGRLQTEKEARIIDKDVIKIMNLYCDEIAKISSHRENVPKILELIEAKLKSLKSKRT